MGPTAARTYQRQHHLGGAPPRLAAAVASWDPTLLPRRRLPPPRGLPSARSSSGTTLPSVTSARPRPPHAPSSPLVPASACRSGSLPSSPRAGVRRGLPAWRAAAPIPPRSSQCTCSTGGWKRRHAWPSPSCAVTPRRRPPSCARGCRHRGFLSHCCGTRATGCWRLGRWMGCGWNWRGRWTSTGDGPRRTAESSRRFRTDRGVSLCSAHMDGERVV
mmetsp:Transcript_32089/g.80726  ORF Transcript_32089/g.80726 Transcript_32089/m.80726 type:complete len:217 (-) Transcript_32089:80-730(-)